jgi:hypothetical protein
MEHRADRNLTLVRVLARSPPVPSGYTAGREGRFYAN